MNWYLEVIKKYGVFKGRARRKEYWMFFLFNMIIAFCLGLIEGLLGINPNSQTSILGDIYQLLVFVPSIAVAIRRMHDVGKSGWFILIPVYNLILAVKEGEKGENKYGADPISDEERAAV